MSPFYPFNCMQRDIVYLRSKGFAAAADTRGCSLSSLTIVA